MLLKSEIRYAAKVFLQLTKVAKPQLLLRGKVTHKVYLASFVKNPKRKARNYLDQIQ